MAGVSRPQVYYSLLKLQSRGLLRRIRSRHPASGPERSVFTTTARGRAALSDALERSDWTTQRERPPFLTWMALSRQTRPAVFRLQIRQRREFLQNELAREEATLR